MRSLMSEINGLDGINRWDIAENKVSKCKNSNRTAKQEKVHRNEQRAWGQLKGSLRDMWLESPNDKKEGTKKNIWRNSGKNSPNLMKCRNPDPRILMNL